MKWWKRNGIFRFDFDFFVSLSRRVDVVTVENLLCLVIRAFVSGDRTFHTKDRIAQAFSILK